MTGVESALLDELRDLGTCTLSDALDGVGIPGAISGIHPMFQSCQPISGRVKTVTLGPRRPEDSVGAHLATGAIAAAEPGDIILVSNSGRLDVSSWGGMLTAAAAAHSLAGVVIDGACRDIEEAAARSFPVYARGLTPVSAKGRTRQVALDEAVTVGGIRIDPGDYLVADANGVVVVPRTSIHEVIALARGIAHQEAATIEAVSTGIDPAQAIQDARGVLDA